MYFDSSTLFHAWNGQSARSHSLSEALKSICEALMSSNCILRLFQVPSVNNLADRPSRSLSLWRIPVCLPVVGSDYKTLLVVQMVIQSISWLFRSMSCARRLVLCCRSFYRTLPRVALAFICFANLPTFIHRVCFLVRTFFRRFASSSMFSASCPHLQSRLPSWFRMFCLVGFGGLLFHIVLHLVCSLRVRVKWVFFIHPPRMAIKISGLCLGIYGLFVSNLFKQTLDV